MALGISALPVDWLEVHFGGMPTSRACAFRDRRFKGVIRQVTVGFPPSKVKTITRQLEAKLIERRLAYPAGDPSCQESKPL